MDLEFIATPMSVLPQENPSEFFHLPVLPEAVMTGLEIRPHGHYLDVTVGGGGHSSLILRADDTVRLTALDQDEQAIRAASQTLAPFGDRVQFRQGNFATYDPGKQKFDGILADLGVSSTQFDQAERGFSFRFDAPLDMRMDQGQDLSAVDIINHYSEKDLADIFFHYGEERLSRRIARRIVERRPLQTTSDLANTVLSAMPTTKKRWRIHPATRVFQALRIAVNRELEVLDDLLKRAPNWLTPQGRLCIISFHSLEDRRVKHAFRGHPALKIITKKPLQASAEEESLNPRSRSAKLRVAEKIAPEAEGVSNR
ncbi:MAG: 16S rRNA (cytosine(1402)-N(4))-methyltransferase RsmH [Cyanobacteria bacterium P01_F01_bin.42]